MFSATFLMCLLIYAGSYSCDCFSFVLPLRVSVPVREQRVFVSLYCESEFAIGSWYLRRRIVVARFVWCWEYMELLFRQRWMNEWIGILKVSVMTSTFSQNKCFEQNMHPFKNVDRNFLILMCRLLVHPNLSPYRS